MTADCSFRVYVLDLMTVQRTSMMTDDCSFCVFVVDLMTVKEQV